jgi:hypothetical protein
MTVEEIEDRVAMIADAAGDPEDAHEKEDRLFRDVLRAITERECADPAACAAAALRSCAIPFPRWCA